VTKVFAPLLFVAALSVLNVFNDDTGEGPDLENSIALCLTIVFVLPGLQVQGRGNTNTGTLDYLLNNNMIILFLFVGLALTSIRLPRFFDEAGAIEAAAEYIPFSDWFRTNNATEHAIADKYGSAEFCGLLGSICFVVAFLIPVGNYVRYKKFRRTIINSGYVLVGENGEKISKSSKDVTKGKSQALKASNKRLAFGKDSSFDQWELDDEDSINAAKAASAPTAAAEGAEQIPRSVSAAGPSKKKTNLPTWPPKPEVKDKMSANLLRMHPVCSVHDKLTTKKETTSKTNDNVSYAPSSTQDHLVDVARSPFWEIHGKKEWNAKSGLYETEDIELHCGVNHN
jgi:hypothetical protein